MSRHLLFLLNNKRALNKKNTYFKLAGKNTEVGCRLLFQEIFQTQGLNLGLLHGRQFLYWLSSQGRPLGTSAKCHDVALPCSVRLISPGVLCPLALTVLSQMARSLCMDPYPIIFLSNHPSVDIWVALMFWGDYK